MICLGLDQAAKDARVRAYVDANGITKIFVLAPEKFPLALSIPAEVVKWQQIIEYAYFYRLLQEIDGSTLVVLNECLRLQNRYDLTYNCIRHFLNQTTHQLIFQYLPLIETVADFMILFDFDTRSRWKRECFSPKLLRECEIEITPHPIELHPLPVPVTDRLREDYAREKRCLIDGIGLRDPHTIPRNIYLMSGKARLGRVRPDRQYLGRNNRFKLPNFQTWREDRYPYTYSIFEFCHNFIDFCDVLALSGQIAFDVLVADIKVDQWYFERFRSWSEMLADAYAALR